MLSRVIRKTPQVEGVIFLSPFRFLPGDSRVAGQVSVLFITEEHPEGEVVTVPATPPATVYVGKNRKIIVVMEEKQ